MERREEHQGGLTFVFTDIEGSTQLVRDLQSSYGLALRVHRRILETTFSELGGTEMGSEGDGLFFVFGTPRTAVSAALAAQRKIEHYSWPDGLVLRVRMGIHCGPVTISGGEYVGLTVHEVARICAAAHGGQILCSAALVAALDEHPLECELRELGSYLLRGMPDARPLFQLCAADLEEDFPPPREAVRDGGLRVSIWQRESAAGGAAPVASPPEIVVGGIDGAELGHDVTVEIRRASSGDDRTFRLIVRRGGIVEEEFDGLTGDDGPAGAAGVVNAHSRFVRVVR